MPVIGDALEAAVGRVVDRLVDRFIPSSLGEKEREELRNEARRLAVEEMKAAGAETQGARALAEKEAWADAPYWTRVLTVTHRPAWSYAVLALFAWTIIAPCLGLGELALTEAHGEIMKTVIIFYFGGRSLEKTAGIITKSRARP